MKIKSELHQLLILSKDFKVYKQLIEDAGLPGLLIQAMDDPEGVIADSADCDLLMGEPSLLCKVITRLSNLQWAQATWAGVEPLLDPELRRDYVLTNARNVYGSMMSEFVFGYLLMIERRILLRYQAQLMGRWEESAHGSLKRKRIGLLGVGTIGSQLAATSHHFGMSVYGFTRQSESCADVDRYFHAREVSEFASELDYIVCALPDTPVTRGMVDRGFLSALPRKAWLFNIGRGSTIDEQALVEALTDGTLAGAVLDVFSVEPLPIEHPLWRTPNTFLTFHTAARNYLPDIASLFIENYKHFINGEALSYKVDFELHY